MKILKLFGLVIPTLVCSSVFAAENIMSLSYDGFFDRIEKLDKPEFQNVKLAFYLKEMTTGKPCGIKSVQLKTKLKSKKVYFYESGEVILPFDKQYDLDKAQVVIEKVNDDNCGLDMRIESISLFSSNIKANEIIDLIDTFDAALEKQTGMLSFLAPEVIGATFLAPEGSSMEIVSGAKGECNDLGCTITKSSFANNIEHVEFSTKPTKALPYIQK